MLKLAIIIMIAAALTSSAAAYLGQPGKVLLQRHSTQQITEYPALVTAAEVATANGGPHTIHVGTGFFGVVDTTFPANIEILGAGTNKTYLIGTQGPGNESNLLLSSNTVLMDFSSFSNFWHIQGASSNCFILRCHMDADSALESIHFTGGSLTISNSYLTAWNFNSDMLDGRLFCANTVIQCDGLSTRGDVSGFDVLGFAYFLRCTFRVTGGTNQLAGMSVHGGGRAILDDCAIQLGTNSLRRAPATGAFTAFVTTGSMLWFRNMRGAMTNAFSVDSTSRVFQHDSVMFPSYFQ